MRLPPFFAEFNAHKKWFLIALALLCITFFAVGLSSVAEDNAVIDENAHIVSGYGTLRDWNMNINLEHPPLVKIIAAVPLLFQNIQYNPNLRLPNQWSAGYSLLYGSENDTDTILFSSRAAVLLFHTLLLLAIGLLAAKFLPHSWALAATALVGFEPNILAHARYVTTDVGVALWCVLGLLLFTRFIQNPSRRHEVLLGLVMGATLLTKFSGALLVVFLGLAVASIALAQWRKEKKFPKTMVRRFVASLLLAFLVVWTTYTVLNFNTSVGQLRTFIQNSLVTEEVKNVQSWLAENPFTRAIPSYMVGFDYAGNRSLQRSEVSDNQYLDGVYKESGKGWPEYFLKAFLYKETPALLFLTLLALGTLVFVGWKKQKMDFGQGLMALFILLYAVLAAFSTLNIGIRHISPILAVLPFLGVWMLWRWKTEWKHLLLLLVLLAHTTSLVLIYPFFLAYFNAPSGGPLHGSYHLDDSNVDWGQNLKRLTQWAEEQGINAVYLDYWGMAPINFYDKKGTIRDWHVLNGPPKDGVLAVMPTWIQYSKWLKAQGLQAVDYSFLDAKLLYHHIGYGIFIYDFR